MENLKGAFKNHFELFTSVLAFFISLLYLWKGFEEGFSLVLFLIIGFNFLYIPLVFIFKKKLFPFFYLIYGVFLVFLIAFTKSMLFNNYTALFVICIIIMINPKFEIAALAIYLLSVCVAFALNEENLCNFLIHVVRSVWFVGIVSYVVQSRFQRKVLVLYDDEKRILEQLCEGKQYQKEVEGFSENTIYRKLKAARERNGCETREQLLELYRIEKLNNK